MSIRAYVLLDLVKGKSEQVAGVLRSKPGVILVDSLEGSPNTVVVVEAPDRSKLAEFIMPAIASVENITEDLRLLVSRDNALSAVP